MSEPIQVLFVGETGGAEALRTRLAPLPVRVFDAADRDPAAPCVVLVAPGEAAPARVAALKVAAPGVPILALLRTADAVHLRALVDAGVDAAAADTLDPASLRATILSVHAALPAPVVEDEDGEALTPRESEVLRLLSAGYSNKEVARRLSVSVRTVETHRLNLRRKTQTGRLRDLVQLARRLGLQPVIEGGARA